MIYFFRSIFLSSLFVIIYLAAIEVQPKDIEIQYVDKFLHFIVFFFLIALLDLATRRSLWCHKSLVFYLILYAAGIEIMQFYTPHRTAETYDFLADLAGMVVYLIFIPKLKT